MNTSVAHAPGRLIGAQRVLTRRSAMSSGVHRVFRPKTEGQLLGAVEQLTPHGAESGRTSSMRDATAARMVFRSPVSS
jgi:hypothetical protein